MGESRRFAALFCLGLCGALCSGSVTLAKVWSPTDSLGASHDFHTATMRGNTVGGMALSFDDDAVHLPSVIFEGLTDFTIEWWVHFDSTQTSPFRAVHVMLSMGGTINGGAATDNLFAVFQDDITRRLEIHFLTTTSLQFGTPLLIGVWYHIAIVRAGTQLHVFINGAPAGVETVSDATWTLWSTGAWLGQDVDCPTGCFESTQSLRGMLDNVRVWSVARTEAEIGTDMTGFVPCGTPGLVADWRFDEPDGQVALDASGHGFDATLGTDSLVPDSFDPQRVFSDAPIPAPPGDCNNNSVPDDCDIAQGVLTDVNGNGIPDVCEPIIPTVSEWGLVVMAVLLLTVGTVVFRGRRRATA